MADNNTQRTSTSTQIRNLYSDGKAYLNISFYNTNLSLRFYPFLSKDGVGRSKYDMNAGQNTTVNFESAFALYQMSKDIIDGKLQQGSIDIPCANNAMLRFERHLGQNGQPETVLTLTKNNAIIPFVFATHMQQVTENGKMETRIIETGLGVFMKTVEGYLTGINADRHLDKLTEEYAKLQQQNGQGQQQNRYHQQQQGGYKRNYNGQNYKKNFQQQGGRQNNWNGPPNQQNMSGYQFPN